MKALIIATSYKPANFTEELQAGLRYRLEYLELSNRLMATSVDYDPPAMHRHSFMRKVEEKIHLDYWWARELAAKVKREGYDLVISMSERIAVPLGYFLDRRVKHIAVLINTRSSKWLFAMKALRAHRLWDKIVTYSHAEAADLERQLGLETGTVVTIHNYVDTEFFTPQQPDI